MKNAPVPTSIKDFLPTASKTTATPVQIKAMRLLAGDQSAWDLPGRVTQKTYTALRVKGWSASGGYGERDLLTEAGREIAGI